MKDGGAGERARDRKRGRAAREVRGTGEKQKESDPAKRGTSESSVMLYAFRPEGAWVYLPKALAKPGSPKTLGPKP